MMIKKERKKGYWLCDDDELNNNQENGRGILGAKNNGKNIPPDQPNKSVYFLFFVVFSCYWWNISFLFSNIDDIYQISNEIKQNISPICIKIIELNRCWRFDDDNDDDTGRYVNKKQVKGKKVQVFFVLFVCLIRVTSLE